MSTPWLRAFQLACACALAAQWWEWRYPCVRSHREPSSQCIRGGGKEHGCLEYGPGPEVEVCDVRGVRRVRLSITTEVRL